MEEILRILNENSSDANNGQMSVVTEDSYSDVVEEIHEYYMEFIDWMKENCDTINISETYDPKWFWEIRDIRFGITTEEVYQYWLNNIKK